MLEIRQTGVPPAQGTDRTIAVNIVFLSLAWTAVAMRIYTRFAIVKSVQWEDGLAVVSAVLRSEQEHLPDSS
jgi:hypothetical protein